MCGIAGIFNLNGSRVDSARLTAMTDRLKHRGPDGTGHYLNGPIGLGQTRLAVIDVEGESSRFSTKTRRSPSSSMERSTTLKKSERNWKRRGICFPQTATRKSSSTSMKKRVLIASGDSGDVCLCALGPETKKALPCPRYCREETTLLFH